MTTDNVEIIERRKKLLGSAYKLFYRNPVHLVRGDDDEISENIIAGRDDLFLDRALGDHADLLDAVGTVNYKIR